MLAGGAKQKSPEAVPERAMLCGLPGALFDRTSVPDRAAGAFRQGGAKVSWIEHVPPGATLPETQVSEPRTKSARFVPVTLTPLNNRPPA